MSQGIPLPPPFKGQTDQVPEFSISNPYAVWLRNFNVKKGGMTLRSGHQRWATITRAVSNNQSPRIVNYGTTLFVVTSSNTNIEVYDSSLTLVYTVAGTDYDPQPLYFNGRLFLTGANSLGTTPRVYDGTTWAAAAYTWPGTLKPFGGAVYKNRAYFIGANSPTYAYSAIDAISGVTTLVDLSTVITKRGNLLAIRPVSSGEATTPDAALAFIFDTGEILVYSGSYPDSASWSLISRFEIGDPISSNSLVDAKGDTFILTRSEILSLRNVVTRGYDVERKEGIGAAINARYRQLAGITGPIKREFQAAYDKPNDRLIFSFPYYIPPAFAANQYQDQICFLIYSFDAGAWCEYRGSEFSVHSGSIAAIDGVIWFLAHCETSLGNYRETLMKFESTTNFLDDAAAAASGTVGIPFYALSAPHPLNRFGVVKTDGLEVIMKSDIYPAIDFRLLGDIGAQSTSTQKTSGNGTNITKTFVNLGIESNLVQYEITGTSMTSTTGIEIYGTNLWVNPSQGVAR